MAGSATAAIVVFLDEIGLPVRFGEIAGAIFLPGMRIERGGPHVDESRLIYPGDLLYDAGHLALLPPERRAAITGEAGEDAGREMVAIAWCYAGALQTGQLCSTLPAIAVRRKRLWKTSRRTLCWLADLGKARTLLLDRLLIRRKK